MPQAMRPMRCRCQAPGQPATYDVCLCEDDFVAELVALPWASQALHNLHSCPLTPGSSRRRSRSATKSPLRLRPDRSTGKPHGLSPVAPVADAQCMVAHNSPKSATKYGQTTSRPSVGNSSVSISSGPIFAPRPSQTPMVELMRRTAGQPTPKPSRAPEPSPCPPLASANFPLPSSDQSFQCGGPPMQAAGNRLIAKFWPATGDIPTGTCSRHNSIRTLDNLRALPDGLWHCVAHALCDIDGRRTLSETDLAPYATDPTEMMPSRPHAGPLQPPAFSGAIPGLPWS